MDGTFQLGFTPIEQGKQVGLGVIELAKQFQPRVLPVPYLGNIKIAILLAGCQFTLENCGLPCVSFRMFGCVLNDFGFMQIHRDPLIVCVVLHRSHDVPPQGKRLDKTRLPLDTLSQKTSDRSMTVITWIKK